jgi:hypothetical protein
LNGEPAKPQMDELLLPFIQAVSESESTRLLEQIICNHAQPLVQNIINYKLKASAVPGTFNQDGQEAEDLSNEVIVRLIRTLGECKTAPEARPIVSLRSYVAVMAYNASDEYLRQKYPKRFSLKNKIKYLLTHQSEFALWEDTKQKTVGGFAGWQQAKLQAARSLTQKTRELQEFLHKQFAGQAIERLNLAELLDGIFTFSDSPIEIDDLVTLVAELTGIRDLPMQQETEEASFENEKELSTDPRDLLDASFDHRAKLERVWKEVCQLPVRQRLALLLNLKDEQGESAIVLLPMLRIASLHQIAESLDMSAEALAAIWNELPIDDIAIAERLGGTRQQVINLRKCARERLARRMLTVSK